MNTPLLRISVFFLSLASTSMPALAQGWTSMQDRQALLQNFLAARRGVRGGRGNGMAWWIESRNSFRGWWNTRVGGTGGGGVTQTGGGAVTTGGGGATTGGGGTLSAPEIDASTGLLALAAIFAALAFAWEVRRRRAAVRI